MPFPEAGCIDQPGLTTGVTAPVELLRRQTGHSGPLRGLRTSLFIAELAHIQEPSQACKSGYDYLTIISKARGPETFFGTAVV
jgi:hypothetical protein